MKDILSGHEGPVHGLAFSPTDASVSLLISYMIFYTGLF